MKKNVNGKQYNSMTARVVGRASNDKDWVDAYWCIETLHRKRTGEYFLHGAGGSMSRYARRNGTVWTDGEDIIPMTYEVAKDWAKKRLPDSIYRIEFEGHEGDSRVVLHSSLPAELDSKLRIAAVKNGLTVTAMLEQFIRQAVDTHEA